MLRFFLAAILAIFPITSRAQFIPGTFSSEANENTSVFAERVLSTYIYNINLIGPTRVPISVNSRDCGTDGAFYQSSRNSIIFCNELIESILHDFLLNNTNAKIAADYANGALTFIAYHEAAHVFIDHYQLPITGKEEDVADQIALFFLLEVSINHNRSESHFINGPIKFFLHRMAQPTLSAYADEHSLSQQRIANMACWAYGYDADIFRGLIRQLDIPKQRSRNCAREFQQIKNFMYQIFIPAVTENRF